MARLRGTNVQNQVIHGYQGEDGYVQVKGDGYTVANTLVQDTCFSLIKRTGVGLWSATFKEPQQCNLLFWHVDPVLYTGSSPAILFFVSLTDNVGVTNTTLSTGTNPCIINWMFANSSGVATDLPANAGFRYKLGTQLSTAYYVRSY